MNKLIEIIEDVLSLVIKICRWLKDRLYKLEVFKEKKR